MKKIKLYIIDDHLVVVKGLSLLCSFENDIEIIGSATSGDTALNEILELQPDVVLSDITMPGMSGLEVLDKVKEKNPAIPFVILSMHKEDEYVATAMDSKASAYLFKDCKEDEIIETVRQVFSGTYKLPPEITEILARRYISRNNKKDKLAELTKREREILGEIVKGKSNKMVAGDLFIAEKTVSVHRYNLMKKLEAKNTADLVRITLEQKLLE